MFLPFLGGSYRNTLRSDLTTQPFFGGFQIAATFKMAFGEKHYGVVNNSSNSCYADNCPPL